MNSKMTTPIALNIPKLVQNRHKIKAINSNTKNKPLSHIVRKGKPMAIIPNVVDHEGQCVGLGEMVVGFLRNSGGTGKGTTSSGSTLLGFTSITWNHDRHEVEFFAVGNKNLWFCDRR